MDQRLLRFFELRGIKRVSKTIDTMHTPSNEDTEIFDFLSLETNDDADMFYRDRRESFNNNIRARPGYLGTGVEDVFGDSDSEDDPEVQGDGETVRIRQHGGDNQDAETINQTVSHATDDDHGSPQDTAEEYFDMSSNYDQYEYTVVPARPVPDTEDIDQIVSSYINLEIHDPVLKSILQHNEELINPHDPDLSTLQTQNISEITLRQPATKFKDHLNLTFLGASHLNNHEFSRRYKNNLSVSLQSYLINASHSEIMIYEYNQLTHLPNEKPLLKFDTKPYVTTTSDRLISTWSHFPHTINYLKLGTWLGRDALGVCVDDGMVLIYFIDTILSNFKYGNSSVQIKINADYKLKLESSVWGLDFLSYEVDHIRYNLLVCSDNSQSITMFAYSEFDNKFSHVKSHQILHNIPDVSFMNHAYHSEKQIHSVNVSCGSISGELITFNFRFQLEEGPAENDDSNAIYYVDATMDHLDNHRNILTAVRFSRFVFFLPNVVNRVLLNEDVWTTKPCSSKYFKSVDSLAEVFGGNYNEAAYDIIKESLIFESISTDSSGLGLASKFQFFECPVVSLLTSEVLPFSKLTTVDDDFRRINKMVDHYHTESGYKEEIFMLISTSKKVGLFNEQLLVNCHTNRLFTVPVPHNEVLEYSNRISITHVIPELSAFIVVSQQGLVSIMRLTQHRGVYGMRQEFIFPNVVGLALGQTECRTILGLAVKNITGTPNNPRYVIYLSYNDGLVLCYDLSDVFSHNLKDDAEW